MNKRANLFTDLFVWMVVVFAFAVVMILIYYGITTSAAQIMTDVIPNINIDGVNATDIANNTIGAIIPAYENLKWITYALIIGSILTVILGNFLVRIHPIFAVPYVLIIAIAVVISVPLSNAYEDLLYSGDSLGTIFQGFYGTSWIFLHLPIWVLIIGILGGITLFIGLPRDKPIQMEGF